MGHMSKEELQRVTCIYLSVCVRACVRAYVCINIKFNIYICVCALSIAT